MHKFILSEDLSGKFRSKRPLYEILTIDRELLLLIYFKMEYYHLPFNSWTIELWKMFYQRESR